MYIQVLDFMNAMQIAELNAQLPPGARPVPVDMSRLTIWMDAFQVTFCQFSKLSAPGLEGPQPICSCLAVAQSSVHVILSFLASQVPYLQVDQNSTDMPAELLKSEAEYAGGDFHLVLDPYPAQLST